MDADPDFPAGRREDRKDNVAAQAVRVRVYMMVIRELILTAIMLIQTSAKSADPQHPAPVFINGNDVVVAQADRISRIVLIMNELLIHLVETIQSARCPDPQLAGPIDISN